MRFVYEVTIDVERDEGKFAGRDEIGDLLIEALNEVGDVSLSGLGADGTSEYTVADFSVDEVDPKEIAKRDRAAKAERAKAARTADVDTITCDRCGETVPESDDTVKDDETGLAFCGPCMAGKDDDR